MIAFKLGQDDGGRSPPEHDMQHAAGLVVHPRGGEHDAGAEGKGEGEWEVEEGDGGETGDDDAQTGSEAFENVVGIFDHQGRDEATKDLDEDGRPRPRSKVVEEV